MIYLGMPDLDSPRWQELQDAYGPATEIAKLLSQLQSDASPKASSFDEPWFSLWPALCHQGDVYTASYAAVPAIVATLRAARLPIAMDFFLLPVCIELARVDKRGPDIPPDLQSDYASAIKELPILAKKFRRHHRSVSQTLDGCCTANCRW
jgi:hypothetical protein